MNAYYSEGVWGRRAPARKATRSTAAVDTDPAERENVAQSHCLEQPSGSHSHHWGFGSAESSSLCPLQLWKLVLMQEMGNSTVCPPHYPSPNLET